MVNIVSNSFIQDNIIIVIIAFLSVVILAVIILIEIMLKKKIREKERQNLTDEKANDYIGQLKRLKYDKKSAKEKLNKLNLIAKNYFHDFYGISHNLSYSEIMKKLEEMKKPDYLDFCRSMIEEYYSEERILPEKVTNLISLMIKTIGCGRKMKIGKEPGEKSEKREKMRKELNNFIEHLKKSHKIMERIHSNPHLARLERANIRNSGEMSEFFRENKTACEEIKNISSELKNLQSSLDKMIKIAYEKDESNEAIKSLIKEWRDEKNKISPHVHNPIKQHRIEFHLLEKYYRKFMALAGNNSLQ